MSEVESSGEELIDDEGRNPTQRALDENGPADEPVDAGWDDPVEDGGEA